jgi:tRNA-specific 2-thiouridylase
MIRYRSAPALAVAAVRDGDRLHLRFERPQRAITPGQLVALLDVDSEEILGAATITAAG